MLPGGTQQENKRVAENCVAQMTDVRGLVGIDAGVLNQGMKMGLLFYGFVACDRHGGSLAVQLAIDIAGASDSK